MKTSTIAAAGVIVVVLAAVGAAYVFLGAPTGTLVVKVTDTPVSTASHIYLSVSTIVLQGNGNSSTSFKVNDTKFDLLSMLNVTKLLGSNKVPAGNYTMIRFNVTSASATINGVNVTLNVPSGEIKVPLHPQVQVKSGMTTTVVLDITVDATNISASSNLRPTVLVKQVIGPA